MGKSDLKILESFSSCGYRWVLTPRNNSCYMPFGETKKKAKSEQPIKFFNIYPRLCYAKYKLYSTIEEKLFFILRYMCYKHNFLFPRTLKDFYFKKLVKEILEPYYGMKVIIHLGKVTYPIPPEREAEDFAFFDKFQNFSDFFEVAMRSVPENAGILENIFDVFGCNVTSLYCYKEAFLSTDIKFKRPF